MEQYQFDDGTLNAEQIVALINQDQATDGNDRITGFGEFADTLSGGLGNDYLTGGDGSDTYVFRRGDGQDTIDDNGNRDTDVLRIEGYTAQEMQVSRHAPGSNTLEIRFTGTDDRLLVLDTLNGSTTDQIEKVVFDDGTELSIAEVKALLPAETYTDISGSGDPDVLESTSANETLSGGNGSDTYIYDRGDGTDIISDTGTSGGSADILVLRGIGVDEVSASKWGNHLVLTIAETAPGAGDGGQIRVDQFLDRNYQRGVETIEFDDGDAATDNVVWTPEQIRAWLLSEAQTAGHDEPPAFATGDTYEAGAGDDIIEGGGGSDTYIYNRGDGKDVISEAGSFGGGVDKLILRGIDPADVSLDKFGAHLILTIMEALPGSGDGGQIRIDDFLDRYYDRSIETIEFDDGDEATANVVWTFDDVRAMLIAQASTDRNDALPGFDTDDTYEAGVGDDYLAGGDGSDTYIYNRGDGKDVISEAGSFGGGVDKLILRGVDPADVSLDKFGAHLILTIMETLPGSGDGGEIRIDDFLDRYYDRSIETIEFDDGDEATANVVWAFDDVRAMLIARASSDGNDTLPGFDTGDTYEAGDGDDYLAGGEGSDTYIYNRGDDNAVISETAAYGGEADRLVLRGIAPADISIVKFGNHLILTIAETAPGAGDGGQIRIDEFVERNFDRSLETIEFDDGDEATANVVWTFDDVRAMLIAQASTDGNDAPAGFDTDDTYESGAGDDYLSGGDGSDTYIYNRGDGSDVISETATFGGTADRLVLRGIDPADVSASKFGSHLILTIAESAPGGGDGGQIRIDQFLERYFERSLEFIEFDDGDDATENVVWDVAETRKKIIGSQISTTDDKVVGFSEADVIEAGLGNDTLSGLDGDDTYIYNRGDGIDAIIDSAGSADMLELRGIDPDDVIVRRGLGDDLELIVQESWPGAGDGGRIVVRGSFPAAGAYGIETIAFTDDPDTVWTRAEFETLAARNTATPGDDRLEGTSGNDTLNGLAGDDYLIGGLGDDVYRFERGAGKDLIRDAGDGADTIEIAGYTLAELTFTRRGREGRDLIIRAADGDEITVVNALAGTAGDAIEQIVIVDDATTLTFSDVQARLVLGTADENNNQIIGTDGHDTLQGDGGNDLLAGGAGNDTYLWQAGEGDDLIVDDGTETGDRLVLTGIASTDLAYARRSPANGHDLVLRLPDGRDRITVRDALNDDGIGIEEIQFTDTVWQIDDMRRAVVEHAATDNAETIRGFESDDTLFSLGGSDLMIGDSGNDTYRFAQGDGHDVIDDQSSSVSDRLEIVDLLSSEASVERLYKGSESLVIRFAGNNDDTITIKHALSETGRGIETIVFGDNVEWNKQDLLDRLENNAPVAVEDGIFTVRQEEVLLLDPQALLRNDYDANGDDLFVIAVNGGADGTAEIDGNGNIVFTGKAGFTGPTSFTYTAADGQGGFATGTVSVRVSPLASARDDEGFNVDEDGFLTIETVRLLSNDADGDRMIVSQVLGAQNGTVSLSSNGEISFTPAADFNGLASFRYVANTPEGGRTEATVYINVTAQNDAPTAFNDIGFTTDEDQAFSIEASELLANDQDIDGDTLQVTAVIGNADVQVELTDDGVILVTPAPYFFGQTSFDYTISDGNGESSTATVQIDVAPVNNDPEPQDDNFTINEDEPTLLDVSELLANDIERDGDPLVVSSVRGGYGGTAVLYDNGTVLFTPNSNFNGQAHFFYTVDDGQGGLVEARANVQVDPVNDAPSARDESYDDNGVFFLNGTEDIVLTIAISDLLANDTDIEGLDLSLVSISFAENGTAEISGENIIFTPDADYWGEAQFRYVIRDEGGLVDDAAVTMYFDPVGDAPPVAANDVVTIYEDVETVIPAPALLSNDTDIDLDPLEIISVTRSLGFKGSVRLNDDGDIVFTPALNSNQTSEFSYTVTDNADGSDTARVRVNIIPVNDAPTANHDAGATSLDAPLVLRISDLLANDEDVDNDASEFSFEGIRFLSDGTYSIYNDEFVVVEYEQGFSGEVSLDYTIADIEGAEDDGTVVALISDQHLDTLTGSDRRDLVIGTHLAETILGLAGDDDLFGREGNDLINGGDGADQIDGGAGFDTVTFEGSNVGVRADLAARIGQGGFAQGDIYVDVEALSGTIYADELLGDTGVNILTGLGGNDLLDGREGDDTLLGGAGDDRLLGGLGADLMDGGEGNDTADYAVSAEAVQVSLAAGTASGGDAEGDTLNAIENLTGSDRNDVLEGDGGDNRLVGRRGNDRLIGGAGNDILIGGRGADILEGGEGVDRVEYTLSDSGVTVNLTDSSAGGGDALGDTFSSIELIVGSFHDDTLIGDSFDNVFMGGRGADIIDGGGGFDTADYSEANEAVAIDLEAGSGSAGEATGDHLISIEQILGSVHDDVISGGSSAETFAGGLGNDILSGRAGSDTYRFGFDDGEDVIQENGDLADVDRLSLADEIRPADVSLLWEGDDLLIEFEQAGGILTDTVRVADHFLGRETGIEEIAFGNGTVWDRDQIDTLIRAGRFNAQDDIIRFADEDVALVITPDRLTGNDATEDTDALEIVAVSDVSGGSATLNVDGTVTFLGDQDFNGDAFFDYTVRDTFGRESTARAEVNVLPVNDAPVAADDGVFIGVEDTVLVIPLDDILGNDFDVDGDTLTVESALFGPALDENGDPLYPSALTNASNGLVTVQGNEIHFRPNADHYGFAGFTYTISDGNGETATTQVELNFLAVNDAPQPIGDGATVRLGRPELIEVSRLIGNDTDVEGDDIFFVTAFNAENGTIELLAGDLSPVSDPADAVYVRFAADALGDASFTYTVRDELGATANGTVEIRVIPLNDPPVARNDSGFETIEDQVLIIDPADLLANDSDPEGDPLSILELEPFPLNGKVAFNDDGMIVFTPRADYNGLAGFTYTVTDGKNLDTNYPGIDTAFVSISIVPDNDAPQLRDDVVEGVEDLPITVIPGEAFANDLEPDGDVIFFESARFIGVLENDFTNRAELTADSSLDNPVIDAANTSIRATLDNGSDLPAWLTFDAATLTFTGTMPEPAPEAFDVTLQFTYTDPDSGEVAVYEDALTIEPADAAALADGLAYEADLIGLVGGAGTWSADMWTGHPLPGWLEFGPQTQEFALTGIAPDADESIARVRVRFTPDDAAKAPYEIEVRIDPAQPIDPAINALFDDEPYFAAQGLRTLGIADDAVVTAQEADLTPLPDWLAFDPDTLTFTGTPPEKYVGTISVRVDIGASVQTGQPGFALIQDIVVDEALELTNAGGFTVTVFEELIDLVTPEDFNGAFAIEYTARDTKGAVSAEPAIIVINVEAQPELPDANDDSFEVLEDGQIEFTLADLLANDGDDDGDPIHVIAIRQPSTGTLEIRIPKVNFDLPGEPGGSYLVELQDGSALPDWLSVDEATGSLRGTPPVDFAGTLVLRVVRTGQDGDVETFQDLAINGNDGVTFVYTAEPEYSGPVTFDYDLTDNAQGTDTGTVTINVLPANDPPIAADDTFDGVEDTSLTMRQAALVANDVDVDGDTLRVSSVLNAVNGTVELVNGEIVFTPDHNFDGVATFDYVVTDDQDGEDTGTVTINVAADNAAPVTVVDRFEGIEDTPFSVTLEDILGNDYDPNGDEISFVSFSTDNEGGTVLKLPDGSYALTPRGNFTGEISFTYTITDGRLNSEQTGNVIVDFAPVNDAPEAVDDGGYTIEEDQTFSIDLAQMLVNDTDVEGDSLFVSRVLDPVNGTVEIVDGQAVFTPRADYFGNAGFAYEVSDGNGGTDIGFVSISITPGQDLPIAVSDDGFTINEDSFVDIAIADLLANDVDPDGDAISFVGVTGAVQLDGDTIRFTPAADVNGRMTFTYSITDGNGPAVSATVYVDVLPQDDDPTAGDDQVSGTEDQVLVIPVQSLLANDGDVDGHNISIVSVQNAEGGTASLDGAGNILFTPTENYAGAARFEYTLQDVSGATDTATVSIDLQGVNDAPEVATPLPDLSSTEDGAVSFQLPADAFTDEDGDVLTLAAALADGSALPAWLMFDADAGSFTGTPPQDFTGALEVRVTASDGALEVSGTFTLTITPVNDAPVAAADGPVGTSEDGTVVIAAAELLANDQDADGDLLTLVSVQDAVNGSVALNGDGDVMFTPAPDFHGVASFSYTVSDGEVSSTATVTVGVEAVNDAPVAADDMVDALEDEVLVLPLQQLLDNDADPDGDVLLITEVSSGEGYSAALDGNGNVVISFTENLNGEVQLAYTVSDGELTDSASLTINVAAVNDRPTVRPLEDRHVDEDTPIDFTLASDIAADVDGDNLTFSATRASGAALPAWLQFDAATRRFSGTPPANFAGTVAIAVVATDGTLSHAAEFDLVVDPVNDAPMISMPFSDRYVNEDEAFVVELQRSLFSDVDGDALSYSISLADGSALPQWLNADIDLLQLSGLPPQDFTGVLDIRVTASDGALSVSDVFKLTVNPVNDAPELTAPLDDKTTDDDGNVLETGTPFVLTAQTDLFIDDDGDTLAFASTLADGSALPSWLVFDGVTYSGTAPSDAAGSLDILLKATDGSSEVSDVFTLTFENGNSAPVATDDVFEAEVGFTLALPVEALLVNDSDPDGDTLTVTAVSAAGNGETRFENGIVTYTPGMDFEGTDQFTYTVSDGSATATATVSVNVTNPYDDIIIGGAGSDVEFGGSGDDYIDGGAGSDILFGGRGADTLVGGEGNDILFGNGGQDSLRGGAGDDLLFGGAGTDTFYYETGDGRDVLFGSFRRSYIAGDEVALSVNGVESFADLIQYGSNTGGGVLFDFGNGDEFFLAGTRLAALDDDKFTFY
ncbi:tandem-95 repeat protein [Stappia taiwanensis]|uniref:tandem-95 repeat protein n=1 Tax=Stappia taiwanensis TaxID=992267 RepID=UPI001FCEC38B|nr:tandem-95 repeat protein [Stappia taiwanensis]